MSTPLGGVSDGRGILSLLTGFAHGYQGAKQLQYQRQMAQAQMQMANAYKQGQLGVQQQRADAYGQNIGNMATYHEGMITNGQDRNRERYDAMLASGALSPEGYAALTGIVPGGARSGGSDTQAFPGDSGAPAQTADNGGQGFPGDAAAPVAQAPAAAPVSFMGPATQAKIDRSKSQTDLDAKRDNHMATADVGSVIKLLGNGMPKSQQAPYLKGVEAANPAITLQIPGETVIGQRSTPQAGPVAPGQSLPDITSPIFADYYSPDMKTQADIDAKNAAAKLAGANATFTAGSKTKFTDASTANKVAQTKEIAPNAQSLRTFRSQVGAAAGTNATAHMTGVNNEFILGTGRNGIAQQNTDIAADRARTYVATAGQGRGSGASGYGADYDKIATTRSQIQKRLTELSTPGQRYDSTANGGKGGIVPMPAQIAIQSLDASGKPVPGPTQAQAEYAQLKAKDKELNDRQWVIKQRPPGQRAGGFVGARPNDDGQPGCADGVCLMARHAGLPVPQTRNAAELESRLSQFGWVEVDPAQTRAGDIIAMPGTGPSGRHVGMAAGGGLWDNDPGKRSHNTIVREALPTGAGVRAYRYQGKR